MKVFTYLKAICVPVLVSLSSAVYADESQFIARSAFFAAPVEQLTTQVISYRKKAVKPAVVLPKINVESLLGLDKVKPFGEASSIRFDRGGMIVNFNYTF